MKSKWIRGKNEVPNGTILYYKKNISWKFMKEKVILENRIKFRIVEIGWIITPDFSSRKLMDNSHFYWYLIFKKSFSKSSIMENELLSCNFRFWRKFHEKSMFEKDFEFRIFYWNFDFRLWTKIWFFFYQNLNFWPKFEFLTKIWIFDQNLNIWPKFEFLTKIWIFWLKFPFVTKISIFDRNYNFGSKFWFLTNIAIFDQTSDFWLKFRFLTNISILWA